MRIVAGFGPTVILKSGIVWIRVRYPCQPQSGRKFTHGREDYFWSLHENSAVILAVQGINRMIPAFWVVGKTYSLWNCEGIFQHGDVVMFSQILTCVSLWLTLHVRRLRWRIGVWMAGSSVMGWASIEAYVALWGDMKGCLPKNLQVKDILS